MKVTSKNYEPALYLDALDREEIWKLAFDAGVESTKIDTRNKLFTMRLACMRECEFVYKETGSPRASMCLDRIRHLDLYDNVYPPIDMEYY